MTDNNTTGSNEPESNGPSPSEEDRPKRIIGTPSPAETRHLVPGGGRSNGGDTGGDTGGRGSAGEPSGEVVGVAPDIDERAARKAERVVALLFTLSFLGGVAFIASYVITGRGGMHGIHKALRSNYALGASMTVVFLGLAMGITVWIRRLMTSKDLVQERGVLASSPEEKRAFETTFLQGAAESGLTRRPLLRRTLMLATVPLGLAPLVLLRDLGPLPEKKLRHTAWKKGTRLVVDGTGQPIKASDFNSPGAIITVVPEGTEEDLNEVAKSAVVLINIPPEELRMPPERQNWTVDGIVAYSKICTHVGCPAALYEQTTHHILCPCHQSTFDATRAAKVIFGPAARPLPQLPIAVDAEGYLVAQRDFDQPVGPSFWERG